MLSWAANVRLVQSHGLFVLTDRVEEDGSFKLAMRRPHRAVLRLRWLVCRGRATPRRAFTFFASGQAIEFICKQGDNGIVWNILSFWREST